MTLRRAALAAALLSIVMAAARADSPMAVPQTNGSIAVTAGNTFQSIAQANPGRQLLEIQNNNTNTDNCWIEVTGLVGAGATTSTTLSGSLTAAKASILLSPGQSYTRYYPFVPQGPIVATCAGNGDSLYVGIR